MTLTSTQIGFLRGIAYTVVAAIAGYVSDPSHLTFLSGGIAAIVAGLAASFDHYLEANGQGSLFGAVK